MRPFGRGLEETMSEQELLDGVGRTRDRLIALCARLEQGNAAPDSREFASALSELWKLWDRLHARYGLLHEILDLTNDVVFAKDGEGLYAMINSRGAAIIGKPMAEVLGADDRVLFEQADAERIMAGDREVMTTGVSRTQEEIRDVHGMPTTLLTTTSARYDGERKVCGVIGIAQDVTERRRSECEFERRHDRMRSMSAQIVFSEERLRRALASELHNGLGQDIALAKMKLATLRSSASIELHDALSGIEQFVERADRSLRTITFQISPPSLHDLGLVAALQWLGEDIREKYAIDVRVEDDASPGVADERIRVILFRAVRELLINAATHSGVREAIVRLEIQGERIRIKVTDAGSGFDTTGVDWRGYGLLGISEQLKYVGGSMKIASVPGRGTTVTLTAPISEPVAGPTQ